MEAERPMSAIEISELLKLGKPSVLNNLRTLRRRGAVRSVLVKEARKLRRSGKLCDCKVNIMMYFINSDIDVKGKEK